jgi:uncharacterized protein YrzB (UPF0473 family)
MSTEPEIEEQEDIVTLEGEDGQAYSCQILQIFDFDNQEYALLLNLGDKDGGCAADEEDDEKGSLVIMKLSQKGDQAIFQTIESEEEFQRVVAFVEEMAKSVPEGEE